MTERMTLDSGPYGGLAQGPEFARVRAIAAALDLHPSAFDDDCAAVPTGSGELVVSTDASVEDVHFRREWLSLDEIGYRSAMAALSDLAADGASAAGLLAAVTSPADAGSGEVVELMRGVGAAASEVGARVLGGDLTAGRSWAVALTVFGYAPRRTMRAGARPGDGLWVTGELGGARAALESWIAGTTPAPDARSAFARPRARIDAGRWLANHGARAMIDLSDGLAGDAAHLAAASGAALSIDLDRLPAAPDAALAAAGLGVATGRFAAEGGEDYELLVALPNEFAESDAATLHASCGVGLSRIGTVTQGNGVTFLLAGEAVSLSGFQHFR